MLSAKVQMTNAERVRKYLTNRKLTDNKYRIIRNGNFIYFPITGTLPGSERQELYRMGAGVADVDFARSESKRNYRNELMKAVGKKQYENVTKGYDIIGDIAVVEAEMKDAKKMATIVMSMNKNVKTILRKAGNVSGKYRTRDYQYVAGARNFITTYRENGCTFKFDIRKTFFSTRLAFERERINKLVKNNENVLVMFAGIGPFAIEIAKRHKKTKVVGMELNAYACKSMGENAKLNEVNNVKVEKGDVKALSTKYKRFADRIIMPLPKEANMFLDSVNQSAKKGCIVHYYTLGNRRDPYTDNIAMVKDFFASKKRKVEIIDKRVARTYSPSTLEIVLDFKIN